MAVLSDDMGGITAYAAAVNRGYTGTKEEFEQLMYSYTEVAERAEAAAGNAHESEEASVEAKDIAVGAKNEAVSARDAAVSARDASISAKNDSESARDAAISAKNDTLAAKDAVMSAKGSVDETSANFSDAVTAAISDVNAAGRNQKELAKTHAVDSEAWAVGQREGADVGVNDETYHNNSKYYAEQSALAKSETETAKDDAVSAKTAAQTAQTGAETAAASVQSSAAQIQTNADDISELKEDTTQLKSDFTALESDGVAPSAEQILTDKGVTDSVPYHYRKTGGDGADRLYDQIVGGTVCWNQLIEHGNFDNADSWTLLNSSSKTASDNVITATMSSAGAFIVTLYKSCASLAGHKFLVGINAKCSVNNSLRIRYPNVSDALALVANTWAKLEAIVTISANSTQVGAQVNGVSGETISFRNFVMFDLTAMFGSTIADYIYQLEQTTAGAGVAFFKSLFPNDYYAYNTGELVSVSGLSAHVMRDADDNIIRSYPLNSTLALRGIPKLDSNNKLYFDGDTYDADGTVTRKYGIVNLGTLPYGYNASYGFYCSVSNLPALPKSGTASIAPNAVMSNGFASVTTAITGGGYDKSFSFSSAYLYITDSAYTDTTAFKSAMSGVMLVYELATPTTEEADPYQHLQQCDPNGTEEYVSTGIVPIGHNSFYPENLRAKVEQLPWNFASLIAPTESAFVATRNYVTGDLFIVSNVLYKATSNIANGGTITPNTNCSATTLAEIISALA